MRGFSADLAVCAKERRVFLLTLKAVVMRGGFSADLAVCAKERRFFQLTLQAVLTKGGFFS